jgi:hypothetical protein
MVPSMLDLPSGTVTFLFTDIEGSTRLWERDREAYGCGTGPGRSRATPAAARCSFGAVLVSPGSAGRGGASGRATGRWLRARPPPPPAPATAPTPSPQEAVPSPARS